MRFRKALLYVGGLLLSGTGFGQGSHASAWIPFGPEGGDARSLAGDPQDARHLYLGTADGWLYESRDAGAGWRRLALVGHSDDLVLDHIIVDPVKPKHLVVSTWALGRSGGGLYRSQDGGVSWAAADDLRGQSVLSLALSRSDPKVYVAGTLRGVYRSTDAAEHWALISPADSKELHEVESVAIDPADPQVLYAGTWHLPWKTSDGGQTWSNIKDGIIDDSDVFSIIVDPKQPKTVYASACSGIYKSDNAGELFHKVQGIPSTARRTRVLKQDLNELTTVFAGTTEGLFRTQNAGADWSRMTDPNVIVNDVYVDPSDSKHVLLATDRAGILVSQDGGVSFAPANKGFSARQVTSYAADAQRPGTLYVGVINDKTFGGVFESETGGLSWFQRDGGLDGRDVFSLVQAPDGVLVAGTGHGIFRLDGDQWTRAEVGSPVTKPTPARVVAKPNPALSRNTRSVAPRETRTAATKRTRATRTRGARARTGTVAHAKPVAMQRSPRRQAAKLRLVSQQQVGRPAASVAKTRQIATKQPKFQTKSTAKATATPPPATFDGGVFALARSEASLYAATSGGLLTSDSAGKSWRSVAGVEPHEWRFLSAAKGVLAVADLKTLLRSLDGGATWVNVPLPSELTQLNAVGEDDTGETWVGGPEGLFVQASGQAEWQRFKGFYVRDVNSIYFDPQTQRLLITSNAPSHIVLAIHVPDHATTFWDAGWTLRFVRPVGDYLLGATLFDGIVVQPRMVESSPVAQAH